VKLAHKVDKAYLVSLVRPVKLDHKVTLELKDSLDKKE
jgi:hypothetical protein